MILSLVRQLSAALLLLVFVAAPCCLLEGQESAEPKQDQAKIVRAIFESTKTARSEKDFTAFLGQCDRALDGELSDANHKYVVSLTGWAMNRRAEKRLELALKLKKVGNKRYENVMTTAMTDFDKAIIADPQRVRSWMSRGMAHVAKENWGLAILDFTEVAKLKTDEPNGWFNRAEAFYHRGSFEHAIQDYEVALRLNSNDLQSLTGRGLCSLELGKFPEALDDFDKVIKSQPGTDAAHVNRGDALQKLLQMERCPTQL